MALKAKEVDSRYERIAILPWHQFQSLVSQGIRKTPIKE